MAKGRLHNLEMIKLLRKPNATDIDPGVRIAINSLQKQIDLLRYSIYADQTNADSEGNAGTAPPPITVISLTNKSGAGRNLGDVVIASLANESAFTTTTTANDENVIGVVASDSPDGVADAVDADAEGVICIAGVIPVMALSPVNVGDRLVASDTEGYAEKARTSSDPGIFAIAFEEILASSGLIEAEILPDIRFNNHPMFQPWAEYISYDTDGSVTGFSGYVLSTSNYRNSAQTELIEHRVFNYGISGFCSSISLSAYNVDGSTLQSSYSIALSYTGGILDDIIKTLTAGQ